MGSGRLHEKRVSKARAHPSEYTGGSSERRPEYRLGWSRNVGTPASPAQCREALKGRQELAESPVYRGSPGLDCKSPALLATVYGHPGRQRGRSTKFPAWMIRRGQPPH